MNTTHKIQRNRLGHQILTEYLHEKVFPNRSRPQLNKVQTSKIEKHLSNYNVEIEEKRPDTESFPSTLPDLLGSDIEEHFNQIATEVIGEELQAAQELSKYQHHKPPTIDKILWQSGWVRYPHNGQTCYPVNIPLEKAFVFDIETAVRFDNTAVMAGAVSNKAWYVWLHPAIAFGNQNPKKLNGWISCGKDKLIIAHNAGFDRARVDEEYTFGNPPNRWIDTLSMSQAVAGLNSKAQRPLYIKHKNSNGYSPYTPNWLSHGCMANLVDCYNHHCQPQNKLTETDKAIRDIFVESTNLDILHRRREELLEYCLKDVAVTFDLFQVLFKKYRRFNPSDVTFAGHLFLSSCLLPLREDYPIWLQETESLYQQTKNELNDKLTQIAQEHHKTFLESGETPTDPWLSQLDWTPAKSGKTKGRASWYRKLTKKGKFTVTPSSRLTPYLLQLKWDGKPIVFINKKGWCYPCGEGDYKSFKHDGNWFSRMPHSKGEGVNVGDPLGKDFAPHMESGLLSSENPLAQEVLKTCIKISYWTSKRKAAHNLLIRRVKHGESIDLLHLPQINPHGTATRRAVESLWLTVSGAKKHKIGTELKGLVVAPKGYSILQADFDSQELQIGALFGDSTYGMHGATMMSHINKCGRKSEGTDSHSLTAKEAGISRQGGKEANYAAMYYCGVKTLKMVARKYNPLLRDDEAAKIAKRILKFRRGIQTKVNPLDYWSKRVFVGGTDSAYYNYIANIADSKNPRTPVLKSRITGALDPAVIRDEFKPSRMNWVIQSSGVDMLHCFTTALHWLIKKYQVNARFIMSFHDEVISIVAQGSEMMLAWCYQVAHLWSWAYFCHTVGIYDVPLSMAFFSGINIDSCWRKEVDDSQITPSNNIEVKAGKSLTPRDIFEFANSILKLN